MAEPPASGLSGSIPGRLGRSFSWSDSPWRDLFYRCLAEIIGTWLMVFAGTSVVAAAVLAGAQAGLWQVAAVWALGVAMAIYLTGAVSGAHLNPAVSLAFAIFRPRDFPVRLLFPYWASQLLGAALAGLTVLLLYGSFIRRFRGAQRAGTRGAGKPAFDHDVRRIFPQPRYGRHGRNGTGVDFAAGSGSSGGGWHRNTGADDICLG